MVNFLTPWGFCWCLACNIKKNPLCNTSTLPPLTSSVSIDLCLLMEKGRDSYHTSITWQDLFLCQPSNPRNNTHFYWGRCRTRPKTSPPVVYLHAFSGLLGYRKCRPEHSNELSRNSEHLSCTYKFALKACRIKNVLGRIVEQNILRRCKLVGLIPPFNAHLSPSLIYFNLLICSNINYLLSLSCRILRNVAKLRSSRNLGRGTHWSSDVVNMIKIMNWIA